MSPRGFRRHNKRVSRRTIQRFAALFVLCFAFVSGLSLLGRAELRLMGEIVSADSDELALFFLLDPSPTVRLLSEEPDMKIYLLERGDQRTLVHTVRRKRGVDDWEGEWTIDRIERAHGR